MRWKREEREVEGEVEERREEREVEGEVEEGGKGGRGRG